MPSITLKDHYAEHEGFVSDKWDIYLSEYERLFRPLKQSPVTLLEIGVQNGGSLEIWEKYFPNASLILGCDINQCCKSINYASDKIHLIIGDVNQPQTLANIFSIAQEFDIVIDDGSHTSSDIIGTFCNMFPRLKHGGLYIAEDLHCSYWEDYEGGLHHPRSSMAFFKALADILNFEHWGIEHSREKRLREFGISALLSETVLAETHSIEFVNSMCVITKSTEASNRLGKRHIAGKSALVIDIKTTHGTYINTPPQHENRFSTNKIDNSPPPAKKDSRNRLPTLEAKIYWHERQGNAAPGYSEARSSTVKYLVNGERQTLALVFPDTMEPLDSLRLDISDDPAAVILHGMYLVGSGGHELWQWPGHMDTFAKTKGIVFFRESDDAPYTLFTLNDDPRFELVLPSEVLTAIRAGCTLSLDITPCTLASQLFRLFAQSEALMARLGVMGEQFDSQLDQKDRLIANQKEHIQQLEKTQNEQYEQLLRAESQLALLKEIVLYSRQVDSL